MQVRIHKGNFTNFEIDSYLDSASRSHNYLRKNREWFQWKFEEYDENESVFSVIQKDDGSILGAVVYSIHTFLYNDEEYRIGIAFDNFVDPSLQKKGYFSRLIKQAEIELTNRKVDALVVFPNEKSLAGYTNKNWIKRGLCRYNILPISLKSIFNFLTLKNSFRTENQAKQTFHLSNFITTQFKSSLSLKVDLKYLNWRLKNPDNNYLVINQKQGFFVFRIGYRGNLKEAQLLYSNRKLNLKLIKFLKQDKIDVIGIPNSKASIYNPGIPVPNKMNFCFKILSNNISSKDMERITLDGIIYHTY